jgi:hypothetical protein
MTADTATLLRAARDVLAAAREGRGLSLSFDVGPSRLWIETGPRRARGGSRPRPVGTTPCDRDVLAALAEARGPWTTTRVLAELERRGMLHGESTVKLRLARMSKAGLVRASRKAPRGYTLPRAPESPDAPPDPNEGGRQ